MADSVVKCRTYVYTTLDPLGFVLGLSLSKTLQSINPSWNPGSTQVYNSLSNQKNVDLSELKAFAYNIFKSLPHCLDF